MKLAAIALDYDGTIATNDVMDPSVRTAVGEARDAGISVILATGRRLADLRRVAGDLTCFDVVVGENGAVLDFPARGRHIVIGHAPNQAFVDELKRRGVPIEVGESLIEADAGMSGQLIDAIHALEQPLVLTFNGGRVMVLPKAVGKSTGLRRRPSRRCGSPSTTPSRLETRKTTTICWTRVRSALPWNGQRCAARRRG